MNKQKNHRIRILALLVFLLIYVLVTNPIARYEQRHFTSFPNFIWTWVWSFFLTCILFWERVQLLWKKGKLIVDYIGLLIAILLIFLLYALPEFFLTKAVMSITILLVWIILLHSISKDSV